MFSFNKVWAWTRRSIYWIVGILVVLICLRIALPYAIRAYVNRQLSKPRDYNGRIGDVTVNLWRGAYEIRDIHIVKSGGAVPVPFFSARVIDLSLQWSELFHGSLVSEITMAAPRLNFVSGPTPKQSQSGKENNWNQTLESLVPFKINRFELTNAQIHFQNPYSDPPVDIYLTDVSGVATNLTNSRKVKAQLPAGVTARGKALGDGDLRFQIHVNPLAQTPTFEMTGVLTNVNLVALNDFLRAYGKFDVDRGQFALFTSFAAKDGAYDGYAKVFFRDLDVFEWKKERKKNTLEIFWQAIVGTLTEAFKNQPHDQLATKIPITGKFGRTDVHIWSTVGTLLRNAFIQALVPKLDQTVKIQQAEKVSQTTQTNQPPKIEQAGKEQSRGR